MSETEKGRYGGGSVYQRASDGRWIAAFSLRSQDGRRIRKMFSGRTEDQARALLEAWMAENQLPREPAAAGTRAVHVKAAKAIATHTDAQWYAKVRAAGDKCHYCKRSCMLVTHKDHVVPVSRGGSNSIDNVVPACVDCNTAKSSMTGDEFAEWAADTDFFAKPRLAQIRRPGKIVMRVPAARARLLRARYGALITVVGAE